MEQRTKEWLELRRKYVTSTDAAPALGVCAYRSAYRAWMDKLEGQTKAATRAMEHGTENEPKALEYLNSHVKMDMKPEIIIKDWRMSSLDAYHKPTNRFGEIKCPFSNQDDHSLTVAGKVPEKHLPQMAHHFITTGAMEGYYFSWFHGHMALIVLTPDYFPAGYFEKLEEAEKAFYESMVTFCPPPLSAKDYAERDDVELVNCIREWESAKEKMDYHAEQEQIYREKIKILCDNQNTRVGGVKITKSLRRGNVDYGAVPQLQGIDLDQYRKPTSEMWRITRDK